MIKHTMLGTLLLISVAPFAPAQPAAIAIGNRIELGRLEGGAAVTFVRASSGDWSIEIAGTPQFAQPKPAQVQIFRDEASVQNLAGGYQSVRKQADAVVASATVTGENGAAFAFVDVWKVSGASLLLSRNVQVRGSSDTNAGFFSAIRLATPASVKFEDATYFVPGLFYGENRGGPVTLTTKSFATREDTMSAPMTAALFRNGNWVAVLNPSPRGDTTQAETVAPASTPVIDERIQFGALGANEAAGGGVELGFWLPGTVTQTGGMRGGGGAPVTRHRYHPVRAGFAQTYEVNFRFGKSDTFRDMQRDSWRWAWQTLRPQVKPVDVELTRVVLLDHLADQVLTYEGRAGIPFVIDAVSGKPGSFRPASRRGGSGPAAVPGLTNVAAAPGRRGGSPQSNQELADWARTLGIEFDLSAAELNLWPKIVLGFCGKNVEVGQQLIMEAERDPASTRSQRMRTLGLQVIDSIVRIVTMSPAPAAEGFDLRTGQPSGAQGGTGFSLRSLGEDTRTMVDLIRFERAHGRAHPDWSKWVKDYCDWLLTTQRENGSFPGNFQGGSGQSSGNSSGATSYGAIPTLVRMTEETGDKKYLEAAIRAGDFLWSNFSSKDLYLV